MTDHFNWQGANLPYFDDPYNTTRLNERCVEVPIALEFLDRLGGVDHINLGLETLLTLTDSQRGLEIGNVLSHYGVEGHRVVDRHEVAPLVENLDVFDVGDPGEYEWIIAISTLEHVRWDEEPREENGAVLALAHLRTLLRPGGHMLVTVPMGAHESLDRAILEDATGAVRSCTMSRTDSDVDQWAQDDVVAWRKYGERTAWAEAVWIGEFDG